MGDIDIAEIATLGMQLAEQGMKLRDLRESRDALNVSIAALEKEVLPLVLRHTQLLTALTGNLVQPTPQAAPIAQPQPSPGPGPQGFSAPKPGEPDMVILKKRIQNYIQANQDAGVPIVANEMANALQVDSSYIRQAMRELAGGHVTQRA